MEEEEEAPDPPAGSEFSSETGKLIAAWEHAGGDITALRDRYNPLPHWPGGSSGLTIGMGYDLKHQTQDQLEEDWGDILTPEQLERLEDYVPTIDARGRRVDPVLDANEAAVVATRDIEIRYEDAVKVFEESILPRYEDEAYRAFPGLEDADPYMKAAVVSMVYNRGGSIPSAADAAGSERKRLRRKHFLEIRAAVVKKDTTAIAAALRKMKTEHTNPDTSAGLRRRREAEAQLLDDHKIAAQHWYYGGAYQSMRPAVPAEPAATP